MSWKYDVMMHDHNVMECYIIRYLKNDDMLYQNNHLHVSVEILLQTLESAIIFSLSCSSLGAPTHGATPTVMIMGFKRLHHKIISYYGNVCNFEHFFTSSGRFV